MDNQQQEAKQQDEDNQEVVQSETATAQPQPHSDTAPVPDSNKTEPTPKDRQGSTWGIRLGLFLVLVIALMGAGGSYYLFLQLQAQQAQAKALDAKLRQSLRDPIQRLEEQERALKNLSQSAQQGESEHAQRLSRLSREHELLQQKVSSLAHRSSNHWMAAEAEYLVRMAGRKLWLEKDPQTAAGLLIAADERIESMQDPALIPLRKALARDVDAVTAIKGTDIAGTVFTLDSLIARLEKLPLNHLAPSGNLDITDNGISDSITDWRSNLAKTWKAITEDFISIRKRTTDITPLLSPAQQWYLLENIRGKLLQSQLALYRSDQVNYRQSLTMARKWIAQYFDIKDENTQAILDAIDALAGLQLEAVTLSKFESSALLKQLINYGEYGDAVPTQEQELSQ
jgi:uroporphyrin-III C-methyltransferase